MNSRAYVLTSWLFGHLKATGHNSVVVMLAAFSKNMALWGLYNVVGCYCCYSYVRML